MMQPEDEVFEDLDFDLLGGMDLPQPPTDAPDKSRDQTSSQQNKQAASGDTAEAPSAGTGVRGPAGGGGVPYEFDDQMFVMEDQTQEHQFAAAEEPVLSDHQQERDQPEAGG